MRDLSTGALAAVTRFKDPAPQFAGVTKQLITYSRPDGVQLSASLYLPAGYDRTQGPLPFLLWAYPQEFRSASAASRVTGSPYRFTRPTGMSPLFVLTQGYGVLDGPTMPIVAEANKEPNDTYVPQLVASAKAAIDKIVEMGVADRDRIAGSAAAVASPAAPVCGSPRAPVSGRQEQPPSDSRRSGWPARPR